MATNIIPVSDLRRKTSDVIQSVKGTEQVVYITQHGRPAVVLVDYEHYESLMAQPEIFPTWPAWKLPPTSLPDPTASAWPSWVCPAPTSRSRCTHCSSSALLKGTCAGCLAPCSSGSTRILSLRGDPRPPGVRKLVGALEGWRIRVGDYLILYQIDDDEQTVTVVRIRHRSDVYR